MLTLAVSLLSASAHATDIIAHRGASYDAPENTLAAFKLGYEQKADAVELDIYLSKDGEIVVIHDDNTKRIMGVDKKVADQTFDELRQQDAGKWKDARFTGEKLPTLDEAIALIPGNKRLVIEIKCGPEIIPALQQSLHRSGRPNKQFIIIAFSQPTIKAVKKAFPGVEMYWLSSFQENPETGVIAPAVEELIVQAKDANVEGVNLAYTGPIDTAFVQKLKSSHLKCYVWTVDSPTDAERLLNAGVDGITTNRPGWLREQLAIPPRP